MSFGKLQILVRNVTSWSKNGRRLTKAQKQSQKTELEPKFFGKKENNMPKVETRSFKARKQTYTVLLNQKKYFEIGREDAELEEKELQRGAMD